MGRRTGEGAYDCAHSQEVLTGRQARGADLERHALRGGSRDIRGSGEHRYLPAESRELAGESCPAHAADRVTGREVVAEHQQPAFRAARMRWARSHRGAGALGEHAGRHVVAHGVGSGLNRSAASLTVALAMSANEASPSTYAAIVRYRRSTAPCVAVKLLRPGRRLGLCQVTWRCRAPSSIKRRDSVNISAREASSGFSKILLITPTRAAMPARRNGRAAGASSRRRTELHTAKGRRLNPAESGISSRVPAACGTRTSARSASRYALSGAPTKSGPPSVSSQSTNGVT